MLAIFKDNANLGYKLDSNMANVIKRIEDKSKKIDVKNWPGVSTLLTMYAHYTKVQPFKSNGDNSALVNVEQQLKILDAILSDDTLTPNNQLKKWSQYKSVLSRQDS